MKPDEELKKTFKVFVDENDVIHLTALIIEKNPEDNIRSTELVEEAILNILNKNLQKSYNFFVNILTLGKGKSGYAFNSKSRKIGVRIASNKQLKKIAFLTSSIFLKTVIGFIAKASGKNIKGFTDKEAVLKWFREEAI